MRGASEVPLENLPSAELTRVVYDLLQSPPLVEPCYSLPEDLEGFEWLAEQFRLGPETLRDRMAEILRGFLRELPDPKRERWSLEAEDNLLALVQLCGPRLDPLVGDEIYKRVEALETGSDSEKELLAGLLKCLIALERKAWEGFWLIQLQRLGLRYGALIFAGLLEHGLSAAARHLPDLCRDEEALSWIVLLMPSLVDRFGVRAVDEALDEQENQRPSNQIPWAEWRRLREAVNELQEGAAAAATSPPGAAEEHQEEAETLLYEAILV